MSGTIFTHRRPVSMESIHRGDNETFLLRRGTRVNARSHENAQKAWCDRPACFTSDFSKGFWDAFHAVRKKKKKQKEKIPTNNRIIIVRSYFPTIFNLFSFSLPSHFSLPSLSARKFLHSRREISRQFLPTSNYLYRHFKASF